MPKVAIYKTFLESYAKIPNAQQKKVWDFMLRFQQNPTASSINYEPITQARDSRMRTVRIDLSYRAVVVHPDDGDIYVLMWVDHHDKAMDWGCRRVFEINPTTGALQVLDMDSIQYLTPTSATVEQTEDDKLKIKDLNEYGPYETFSDQNLLQTGIPAPLLPAVKALKSARELPALQPYLPEEAYEALQYIGEFNCSVQEALDLIDTTPKPAPANDIETALQHPDSQRRFVTITSTNELQAMLSAPMDKWRVFLHPSQAKLVKKQFNGPARVLGGAGTGKTVVAMHRACYLVKEVFTKPDDRILVTTYNRNLATNIQHNIQNLCPDSCERIEVVNIHRWAVEFLERHGKTIQFATDQEEAHCWAEVAQSLGWAEWDAPFFQAEWHNIVQKFGLTTKQDYLHASRIGRGVRLNRKQRVAVWERLEAYRQALNKHNKIEWGDLSNLTRQYLIEHQISLPYRAIVVDETQDCSFADLRLLRQMATEGPNDLFFVGDAHQRIYGKPVVMGHADINIRGRSHKLKINYRTTEEIRAWSMEMLKNCAIDDMDGGSDTHQQSYTSLLRGEAPVIRHFKTLTDELDFIIDKLETLLLKGVPSNSICIVARTKKLLENKYMPALERAKLEHLYLQSDTDDIDKPGIRLATMHRVKGLEFNHLIMVSVNKGVVPPYYLLKKEDVEEVMLKERCLLHVAATRSRDSLTVTSYGHPSQLVETIL